MTKLGDAENLGADSRALPDIGMPGEDLDSAHDFSFWDLNPDFPPPTRLPEWQNQDSAIRTSDTQCTVPIGPARAVHFHFKGALGTKSRANAAILHQAD
jgi:hypothetical protein